MPIGSCKKEENISVIKTRGNLATEVGWRDGGGGEYSNYHPSHLEIFQSRLGPSF
jgi:hypothetical protein